MLRALGLPGALAHSSLRISQGRKVELENALLSKEQQAALARIKRYTDFNDLATQSSRSQERVKRQVKITVNKGIEELKQKQQQGQQQAHNQRQQRTRHAAHI